MWVFMVVMVTGAGLDIETRRFITEGACNDALKVINEEVNYGVMVPNAQAVTAVCIHDPN